MARRLPRKDAVIVGLGWTGSILAHELTDAGLDVVAIERGPWRDTASDFPISYAQDEWRYRLQHELFLRPAQTTVTFRNNAGQTALPVRNWGAFMLGNGVGGGGLHWNAETFRFLPSDFLTRSHLTERYGASFLPEDMTVQDWGVTYDELEPHYDQFEYLCGTSGTAGNIKGKIQDGGNPFEGARSRAYPTPAMKQGYGHALFAQAAEELGYKPYPQPSGNLSQAYTNPLGVKLGQCTFCGFCEWFGCANYSKASPQTTILPVLLRKSNFEARTECEVMRVNLDRAGKWATGVTYVDSSGEEWEQPADIVLLCAFQLFNVQLLLLSGIGKPYDPQTGAGVVGRNYTYQTTGGPTVFMDESININPFMASGANGTMMDDFGGDNFDHSQLGFIGGQYVGAIMTNGRPIEFHPTPPGTPGWGLAWKQAVARHYNHTIVLQQHGTSTASRLNYLDLDPTYRDAWGLPLLRMTFDFPDNDVRMSQYVADKVVEIGRAMGGKIVARGGQKRPYTTTAYQSTHNCGGAVMGDDPKTSVVNRYLQCWDVPNVFSIGASAFPQNGTYNYTVTIGALTYWALDAIKNKYLKAPGPLVQA